jgi:hypothetical protein
MAARSLIMIRAGVGIVLVTERTKSDKKGHNIIGTSLGF